MGLITEALRDEDGLGDIAFIMIGTLGVCAIITLNFICGMSAIDYAHCLSTPVTTVTKGAEGLTSVVPCRFDPLPIGQAAGLIFGAFSALIASLGGYMALVRRKPRQIVQPQSTVTTTVDDKGTVVQTTPTIPTLTDVVEEAPVPRQRKGAMG